MPSVECRGGEMFRPAEFEFVRFSAPRADRLRRGVPQVDTSAAFDVIDAFHAPPANAVSHEAFVARAANERAAVVHLNPPTVRRRPATAAAVVPVPASVDGVDELYLLE